MVARVEIDRGGGERGRVLPGADRVAEGQRIGARAAGVGRGAAVVEGQRRGAAGRRVTASLKLSVSVTVLPALRSPLAGDSVSEEITGPAPLVSISKSGETCHSARQHCSGTDIVLDGSSAGKIDGRNRQ